MKIGINGFGRIGRTVFRAAAERSDVAIVAINDLLSVDHLAYMLKYDSVHGRFSGDIRVSDGSLVVDGQRIRVTAEKDPHKLAWGEVEADAVVESTGLFLSRKDTEAHLGAGAKQVVITGLGRDADKLALARELGADAAIDVEKHDVVASVRDATAGGAEVVVDTTPYAPQSLNHAVAIAVRKGRIVVAGLKGLRPAQDFAVDDVIYKELTIRGVLSMPVDETFRAIDIIESGRYPFGKMHTASLPLEQAEHAIHMLAGHVPGVNPIHLAIVPGAPRV